MSKINIEVRYPSHQDDARHYDTATLRKHYLVEKIMAPDEINLCYSMFDRIIVGGAMPVAETLTLTSPDILRSEYFTQRREVGVINVGGRGAVTVGSERYELEFKEALYIGRGDRHIVFESREPRRRTSRQVLLQLCSRPQGIPLQESFQEGCDSHAHGVPRGKQ